MSADVEPYAEQPANLPVVAEYGEPSAIERWANDAAKAHQVATSLSKTAFVPKVMQGKSGDITGAILTGAEIGLQPMAAIRSINVIQGTPALSALALRGLVMSAGHDLWVEHADDAKVVMAGKRRGSEQTQRVTWTIDRAKRLGLTGKDNWLKQPQAMLTARATSELCRLIAPDALLGVPYSVEELSDQDTERKAAKPKTVKRAPVVVEPDIEPPAAEPHPEPEATAPEPAEPEWPEPVKPGDGVKSDG